MKKRSLILTTVSAALLAAAAMPLLWAATAAPKGYVISEIIVTDPDAYKQYAAAVAPVTAKLGGKYLVRGGHTVGVEGEPPGGRIVVIEFESLAAAEAFEASPEYQAVAALRHKAARSRVFLAEGVAPQ